MQYLFEQKIFYNFFMLRIFPFSSSSKKSVKKDKVSHTKYFSNKTLIKNPFKSNFIPGLLVPPVKHCNMWIMPKKKLLSRCEMILIFVRNWFLKCIHECGERYNKGVCCIWVKNDLFTCCSYRKEKLDLHLIQQRVKLDLFFERMILRL